jgi:hypothetical protein
MGLAAGAGVVVCSQWFPAHAERLKMWGSALFFGGLVLLALAFPML